MQDVRQPWSYIFSELKMEISEARVFFFTEGDGLLCRPKLHYERDRMAHNNMLMTIAKNLDVGGRIGCNINEGFG